MSRTEFATVRRSRGLDLAIILAGLYGISQAQIDLWIITAR